MSFGDLEGRTLPGNLEATPRQGEDCGYAQFLSNAVRDALKETDFDTLVNSQVTSETSLLVWLNCIKVRGYAINSKTFPIDGDNR